MFEALLDNFPGIYTSIVIKGRTLKTASVFAVFSHLCCGVTGL